MSALNDAMMVPWWPGSDPMDLGTLRQQFAVCIAEARMCSLTNQLQMSIIGPHMAASVLLQCMIVMPLVLSADGHVCFAGFVFGAFTAEPWRVAPRFYGTGETFVFQLEVSHCMGWLMLRCGLWYISYVLHVMCVDDLFANMFASAVISLQWLCYCHMPMMSVCMSRLIRLGVETATAAIPFAADHPAI